MTAFEVPRKIKLANFRIRKPKEKQISQEAKREQRAPGYRAKVAKLPCCICGEPGPSHPHHLKSADPHRGKGQKVENRWLLPLCSEHHNFGVERVGSRQEAAWFRDRGILCLDLAAALWANRHSEKAMFAVLKSHKEARSQ